MIIRRSGQTQFRWLQCVDGAGATIAGAGDLQALADCVAAASFSETWLLVPALVAPMRSVVLTGNEARYARRTIPFQLEDQLLQDVDSLHFGIGRPRGGQVQVAVIDRQWLRKELEALAEVGVVPTICTTEQSLLPETPEALVYFDGQTVMVRAKAHQVARAFDANAADMALSRLALERDENSEPAWLCEPGVVTEPIDRIGSVVGLRMDWQAADMLEWAAPLNRDKVVNLLQADFAPRIDWPGQWRRWRIAAAAVIAAIVLQTLTGWIDLYRQNSIDRELSSEVTRVYRELYPRGALVNARKQMSDQLDKLRSSSGASGFMQHFYPLGERLSAQQGLKVHSLRFDGRNGDLRLDISVPNHQAVEALRANLETARQRVELQSSTTSGGAVRARLAIH